MDIHLNTTAATQTEAIALIFLLAALFPGVAMTRALGATATQNIDDYNVLAAVEAVRGATAGEQFKPAATFAKPTETVTFVVADGKLSPADNPSTGTDTAATVFTQGFELPAVNTGPKMTAAASFPYVEYAAKGWSDEQLIAAGLMEAPPVVDPAAVFGGGTNGPLAGSAGTPPAPGSTNSMQPPQMSDAATVFAATSGTPAPQPANVSGAAPSTNGVQSPELDNDGLPWHPEIHASTRNKTTKGVWKKRKGVDDATVTRITAELRAAIAANKAAAHVPLNAADEVHAPVAPPPPPPPPVVQVASAAPPPVVQVASAAPPPPPAADGKPITFVECARFVGERQVSAEIVQSVCQKHGIAGLALLTQAPNLAPLILADLKAAIGAA